MTAVLPSNTRRQLLPVHREQALPLTAPLSSLLPLLFSTSPGADNYCLYVENYDSLDAAYDWARQTLADHASDKREHVYSR